MGAFLSWRNVALVCTAFPIVTILALCFIPESPYWLLTKGRVDQARDSLAWLRGWVNHRIVDTEFNEIKDILLKKREEADQLAQKSCVYHFSPYFRRSFIAPFTLVAATFFIGHFSGKTPLQTYAVQVRKCIILMFFDHFTLGNLIVPDLPHAKSANRQVLRDDLPRRS